MNPKMIAQVVVIVIILAIAGVLGGVQMNLFTDAGVEQEDVENFIDTYEEDVVEYLILSEFPRASNEDVEIYELHAEDEPKLAVEIDWENKEIEILDETEDYDYNLRAEVPEKLYWDAINRFKTAVEKGKSIESAGLYLNILFQTDFDIPSEGWTGEQSYRFSLGKWANTEHEKLKEYDGIGEAAEGELE